MMEVLKKCPCCGGEASFLFTDIPGTCRKFFISCEVCGLETPRTFSTKEAAANVWNTRHESTIVYCKDCKHYLQLRTKRHKQLMHFCMRMAKYDMEYHVKPNDYCSYGVPREDLIE